MKRVAAEIDSRAGWPVHACVYAERPRLVEVKNPTQVIGVEAPALNYSEPRSRQRQLQPKTMAKVSRSRTEDGTSSAP